MSKCSFELWCIPQSYSINWHDDMSFIVGVTGFGQLDVNDLKITIYSDDDSKLKSEGEKEFKNNTYIIGGNPEQKNLYQEKISHSGHNHLFLKTDQDTVFKRMYVKPGSPGQKRVELVLTYFDGTDWATKKSSFDYKVMTFAEKHSTILSVLAIIGGVVTVNQFVQWALT